MASDRKLVSAIEKLTETIEHNQRFLEEQAKKAIETATKQPLRQAMGPLPWTPQYERQYRGEQFAEDAKRPGHGVLFDENDQPTYDERSRQRNTRQARTRLNTYAQRVASDLPPDSTDTSEGSGDSLPPPRPDRSTSPPSSGPTSSTGTIGQRLTPSDSTSSDKGGSGIPSRDEKAFSWYIGTEGSPAALRKAYLGQWGLQNTVGWAQKAAASVGGSDLGQKLGGIPGVSGAGSLVSKALNTAYENPVPAYLAYATLSHGFSNGMQNAALGQQLGAPAPPLGPGLFGMNNPLGMFSQAGQIGVANQMETQSLAGRMPWFGFGSGLTTAQAQDTTSTLTGQGFGYKPYDGFGSTLSHIPLVGGTLGGLFGGRPTGDAAKLGDNFMKPLLSQFPGLKAGDLGEFDAALRNSGTSISQLRGTLNHLGDEAQTTKETIGEFTTSLAKAGQEFEAMGSSPQGGYALGAGFTDTTGLDPQMAAQIAKSPIMQGMVLSKYGILPSGIGDMNAGAFTNSSMATLQMMQRATSGFNRNIYETVNGHRVLVESGKQQQYDQIAEMTGIPSNIVKRMLGDQHGIKSRAFLEQMKGEKGNSTGLWGLMNEYQAQNKKAGATDAESQHFSHSQYRELQKTWNDTIAGHWKGSGISHAEMKRLSHEDFRTRMSDLRKDLNKANQQDSWNKLTQNPNQNTVELKLTGQAAKVFAFPNGRATMLKRMANAGAEASGTYNHIANGAPGDLSQPPPMFPWLK